MLHKLMDAIRQRLAAHREYERFMSMGMNHDRALRASTVPTGRPITNSQTLSLLIARMTPLMSPRHRAHGDGLA
jgi:hypothetical protein